jgi:hypothetical protein
MTIPNSITRIETTGYDRRGEQDIPGRQFFRRGILRSDHVHLARIGSGGLRRAPRWWEYMRRARR